MSRKSIIIPFVQSSALDLTAPSQTAATNVQYLDGLSYLVSWSSVTGTGTFKVQGSNYDPTPNATQVWADLDLDPVSISGSTGQALVNINSVMFQYIRLSFDGANSAGTAKIVLTGKGTA